MKFIFGNALWHLLVQSDLVTKMIMAFLLLISVLCWTVVFYKWTSIREAHKQVAHLFGKIDPLHSFDSVIQIKNQLRNLYGSDLLEYYFKYARGIQTALQKESLEERVYSHIDDAIYQQSSYMVFLFIAAACGPLIGLFGTVWGLMHSFMNIAQKQTADIVTVAPGIAEALLTTLAGLMVAIPALILYHYLMHEIRSIEHVLYALSDKLTQLVQSDQITSHNSQE